jgi:PmbA protein
VLGGTGSDMQRDFASHSARHYEDLDAPEAIGRLAAERTLARLNPGKLQSGTMPVVFDPRVGGSLVGHLLSAITGSAIARKTSFLLGREGEPVFGEGITIREDPLKRRGLRSKPFDGEGIGTRARDLVANGRVTGWLLDSASARQLGLEPTGHASRGVGGPPGASATNVDLLAGTASRDELIGDIEHGLYVVELIGQGVNQVTGDYSRGASGFVIDKGRIGAPVAEITIAGNLIDMFRTMTAANDLEQRRATNVPTLRVEGMTVAGA